RSGVSAVPVRPAVIDPPTNRVRQEEDTHNGLPGGGPSPPTLAGRDPETDLAALKADNLTIPAATFRDGEVKPGTLALVVGRGGESGVNATMGIISAVSGPWRTWRGGMMDRYIRLDLTLYPGSSGGAVVDTEGRTLGLATS